MAEVQLVGILNVTPDSFTDGGLHTPDTALQDAEKLFAQGASIVDVGGESTRPGATPISPAEEWNRLESFLPELVQKYPDHISVDTYHPETVWKLAEYSDRFILNDVTTFNNPEMVRMAVAFGLRCIVSHIPAQFGQDIQGAHKTKPIETVEQVKEELLVKREVMIGTGVAAEKIILDPGIGFGKENPELNWRLLEFAKYVPGIEVMIGYSQKSFLGENRKNIDINLVAGKVAVAAGAKYLRVHDVAGHKTLFEGQAS